MNMQNERFIANKLSYIRRLSADLDTFEQEYLGRIEPIRKEFANNTTAIRVELDAAHEELLKYLKKNKSDIFPGKTDRVTITGGVLLRQIAKLVRKARHITVDFLRKKGRTDGIRIEEHVDWPKIETWPDDQLALIGTDRREKETFAYELTGE